MEPITYYVTQSSPKLVSLIPSDPASRYKTKQLEIQSLGKGKMFKTVLVNSAQVSKCMQIAHPAYLVHYLAYELNVSPHFFEKQPLNQQAVLSGHHSAEELNPLIEKWIEEFILCQNCGLPELNYCIKKNSKTIWGQCRSCGDSRQIQCSERFQRYVVNHPPPISVDIFNPTKLEN